MGLYWKMWRRKREIEEERFLPLLLDKSLRFNREFLGKETILERVFHHLAIPPDLLGLVVAHR